jgi:anti-sigma regulatory factor (Ser/Thr protein kinase)
LSSIQLEIDSDLENVALVALSVNTICLHAGLNQVHASMVELGIAEAVTNSIQHAYRGAAGNLISVAISAYPDRLEFEIVDKGIGLPPDALDRLMEGAPEINFDLDNFDTIPEHGRGLQIIHDVMDGIEYTQDSTGNHLRLTRRMDPAQSQP